MRHRGARIVVIVSAAIVAACGTRTLDFAGPDGGSDAPSTGGKGGSNGTGGMSGGKGGTGGTVSTTGAGGATAGIAGAGGGAGMAGTGIADAGRGDASDVGNDGGRIPFITKPLQQKPNKVDLLLTIDNSSSMADKQKILSDALPNFVDRLIDPPCVDPANGRIIGRTANGVCAAGKQMFEPVRDIHIGIVTSSLGNHGAAGVCEDAIDIQRGRSDPHNSDQAHLVARSSGGGNVATFQNKGFLYFQPDVPGALGTSVALADPFTDMVKGVGQHGCGYEAPLEAAYRFLVDPDPYATMRIDTSIGGFGQALLQGTDQTVLQQRADFLRPDSLVTVLFLTDENDCSIVDGGQGFYALIPPVAGTGRSALQGGTSVCATNPNDRCCFNCGQQEPPPGCAPAAQNPACQKGELTIAEDPPNLRCFDQKRRYGVDFMYPIDRYVTGFSKSQVPNRRTEIVPNPLFVHPGCGANCSFVRDQSLVVVAGIVGVPWQDIAVNPQNLADGYKTAKQLRDENIWATIVGDPQRPSGPIAPLDPHMIESMAPRPGLAGPGSAANADPIHGHEWDTSKGSPNGDLQYACALDLMPPRTCSSEEDCDCFGPVGEAQNPLCQNAAGGYSTTQLRAKAYPGTRILQVLQGLGDQAVTTSICAAQMVDKTRDDYGYTPATNALLDRVRQSLETRCLAVALPADTTTFQTPCSVIEVFNTDTCNCNAEPGRIHATDNLLTDEMLAAGSCRCQIMQLTGGSNTICRTQPDLPANSGNGWCYVDPAQSVGSCDVVSACRADEKRLIRFINTNSLPRPSATAFLRCDVPPIPPVPSICP